ncbi:MAG: pyridoxamine 5'-phosphate oxidase family protein [Anaerovoracaceae bacterium]
MFRELRRKDRKLENKGISEILEKGTNGILAVFGENGYPYGVPISYVYDNGKIYMHSAKEGHKIDAINANENVSFTVVAQDDIVPKEFYTIFKSVVIFGRAKVLTDKKSKEEIGEKIGKKYAKEFSKEAEEYIRKNWEGFSVIEIEVDHISGKAR